MQDKPKYYNEARNRASQKYNAAKLEQVSFRVHKGEKALIQDEAEKEGLSLAQYLVQAVNEHAGQQVLTPSSKEGASEASEFDRITLTLPKGRKADIEKRAADLGVSLNGYLTHIIRYHFLIDDKNHDEEWRGSTPLYLGSVFDNRIEYPDSPGDES